MGNRWFHYHKYITTNVFKSPLIQNTINVINLCYGVSSHGRLQMTQRPKYVPLIIKEDTIVLLTQKFHKQYFLLIDLCCVQIKQMYLTNLFVPRR